MTDFREYVCWRDAAVLATTPRDAASLGDGHGPNSVAFPHPSPTRSNGSAAMVNSCSTIEQTLLV